jgi:hypothetical protein
MKRIKKMYFLYIYIYEYGALKPIKVTLRRGRGKREWNGGNEPNGIQYMHIRKCHKQSPCVTIIN